MLLDGNEGHVASGSVVAGTGIVVVDVSVDTFGTGVCVGDVSGMMIASSSICMFDMFPDILLEMLKTSSSVVGGVYVGGPLKLCPLKMLNSGLSYGSMQSYRLYMLDVCVYGGVGRVSWWMMSWNDCGNLKYFSFSQRYVHSWRCVCICSIACIVGLTSVKSVLFGWYIASAFLFCSSS